jgi:hypothetical protein
MVMRRVIRRVAQGATVLATIVGIVAVVARLSDGPIFVFPGGPLIAGLPTEYDSVDWAKLADIREVEFQLEAPARSRITRIIIYNNAPYVPCAFCTNRILKRWPRELEQNDRVVLRIDGMLIEGVARRVPNGSEEYLAARRAHATKYVEPSRLRNSVEDRAARVVVGAARLTPGAHGSDEPDSWLYRIDAR